MASQDARNAIDLSKKEGRTIVATQDIDTFIQLEGYCSSVEKVPYRSYDTALFKGRDWSVSMRVDSRFLELVSDMKLDC